MSSITTEFPYSLIIDTPFPTNRLATIAKKAIEVDSELSSLVQRNLSVVSSTGPKSTSSSIPITSTSTSTRNGNNEAKSEIEARQNNNILRTEYRATTNRMLRVAVNGYMESLGVVLEVMQELDVDVLESQHIQKGSEVGGGGGVNGETT